VTEALPAIRHPKVTLTPASPLDAADAAPGHPAPDYGLHPSGVWMAMGNY